MATEAQINANRENAKKSTGPRTEEGKETVSRNAVRHGLSGRILLLTDADKRAYAELGERLIKELEPVTLNEEEHIRTMADCHWQLNLCRATEQQILNDLIAQEAAAEGVSTELATARALSKDLSGHGALEKLARYRAHHQRELIRATKEFDRLKTARLAHNRANIIHMFEQRTRSIFNPKKDRIGTPTGFDLQNCTFHQLLEKIKESLIPYETRWAPIPGNNLAPEAPDPSPQAV